MSLCMYQFTYHVILYCYVPIFQSQKILKDMGVDVTTESTKLGRGTSVKFE